ncbi:MAG TPA: glycosyltransferase family 4 protein [Vicinamibacterales bacterium]|nr:glycosyltransferase family 4 protein [Vicinamibacterales bacterium]
MRAVIPAPLLWTVLAIATLSSWALTGRLRQYALGRQMVDVPNARSSHRVATPRGGGGAIVVAATAALAWWSWASGTTSLASSLIGGLVVAGIGFADDHRHVAPQIRLVGHTVAAVLAVTTLGGPWPGGVLALGLAVVFVAWLINLTNFMDGIDGIAGVQTLTTCAAGAALSRMIAPRTDLWFEPAVLGAASIGFLIWNWPPARVFMGDVGSGFVGFMVAVFTLRAASVAPVLGWCWLILSGVFIVDATFTLARRTMRGDRIFEAHRSHAYQHLAHAWGHRSITLLVAAINLCWLTPVAALVALGYVSGAMGVLIGYLPLAAGAVRFGAGTVSESRAS